MTPAPPPFAEAVLFLHSYLGTCLRPHWWHALVFRGEASSVEPSAPPASAIRPVGGDPSLVIPGCRLFVPGCRFFVPVPVPVPVPQFDAATAAFEASRARLACSLAASDASLAFFDATAAAGPPPPPTMASVAAAVASRLDALLVEPAALASVVTTATASAVFEAYFAILPWWPSSAA